MSVAQANAQPRKLGHFEVLREIGQGGMGVVYLARQPTLDRLVVLKKIRREMLVDPSMLQRFLREARAAAAVHHHNVVGVYDCFEARGDHYIVQEYVEGRDLQSILSHQGRLSPEVAALVALEVVRGIEEIHSRGIVHRDLKPANILISLSGETKIADFGIALEGKADGLTRPGILVGSVPYMAPEQILGQRADPRTDIFLFGILLYEMLTGAPPFTDPSNDVLESLLERMQHERYRAPEKLAPDTPRSLVRLVRGSLRAKPATRIPTSRQVRRSLERALGRPSTHDCRNEIAAYMWDRGVFRATEEHTEVRKAVPRHGRLATRRRLRFGVAGAMVPLLLLAGWGAYRLWRDEESVGAAATATATAAPARERAVEVRTSKPSPPQAAAAAAPAAAAPVTVPVAPRPTPARLRFVADPWAEVRIDGATSLITPRAAWLEVAPGIHRLEFVHPSFGTASMLVRLEPGESRTLRYAFERKVRP